MSTELVSEELLLLRQINYSLNFLMFLSIIVTGFFLLRGIYKMLSNLLP